MSSIKAILSRCITDAEFLAQLKSNPDVALEDYEITDDQREILKSRDARVLDLLGEGFREDCKFVCELPQSNDSSIAQPSREKADVESENHDWTDASNVPQHVAMKPTQLAVRLVPYASRASDDSSSEFQLAYSTHVDPLPENGSLDDLPPPPIQNEYGQPLPTLAVAISIQPFLIQAENGQSISFEVQAQMPPVTNPERTYGNRITQSKEDPSSISVAVEAVRHASSEQRLGRLLDLIHEITTQELKLENRP